MLQIPWGDKLPLLDIDHLAGLDPGDDQIGLAAEKSRHLEYVGDLGHRRRLAGFVVISQDRQPKLLLYAREDAQTFLESRAAIGIDRGAVGLVERGLEYISAGRLGRPSFESVQPA